MFSGEAQKAITQIPAPSHSEQAPNTWPGGPQTHPKTSSCAQNWIQTIQRVANGWPKMAHHDLDKVSNVSQEVINHPYFDGL